MTDLADRGDGRDWARRLMRRVARGDAVSHYSEATAREVLGLQAPKLAHSDVLQRGAQRAAQHATKTVRK